VNLDESDCSFYFLQILSCFVFYRSVSTVTLLVLIVFPIYLVKVKVLCLLGKWKWYLLWDGGTEGVSYFILAMHSHWLKEKFFSLIGKQGMCYDQTNIFMVTRKLQSCFFLLPDSWFHISVRRKHCIFNCSYSCCRMREFDGLIIYMAQRIIFL